MDRRRFMVSGAVAGLGATKASALLQVRALHSSSLVFRSANREWQAAYDRALATVEANVQLLPRYKGPVLIEGAAYVGIWQECGPMEALVYRKVHPAVARNSHLIFFALQRWDRQIPTNDKPSGTGFGQIQMAVPIAATAWELARDTRDEELLQVA